MSVIRVSVSIALASVIGLSLGSVIKAADDPLVRAKELYRTAAYDEALGILDGISAASPSATTEINEYRVFCLVALDRKDDARSAITALVTADPSYQLSESQASPRVRAVFKEVRETLLPSIIQRTYTDAKAAFDRKDPQAAAQFERVLTLLKDPDLKPTPELSDLAVVAAAFRDLGAARDAAAAKPAAAAVPAPVVVSKPAEPMVYRDGEPNFTPATIVNQGVPTAVLPERRIYTGAVEVLIDETGKVLSAKMATPIFAAYDKQLIQTALNTWKYKPAQKNGAPARYIKIVNVRIDARPACSTFVNADCRPVSAK
jgi:hypothetical protein